MAVFDLLSLELRAGLDYSGIENPALAGIPASGTILLPAEGGGLEAKPIGADLSEGEEEIFVFDDEDLIAFDPDEGPRLRVLLPSPRFYGRSESRRAPATARGARSDYNLPPGLYLFLQFRPKGAEELAEGLEWFAREAWWERSEAYGPWIVRRVREDGGLATQLLRRKR